MNHIQNFYKNKCENLTEQINYLKNEFNTLITEKSRGFNVAQEQQNLLHPPAWYTNRGLPSPWDAMSPKQRSRELERLLNYYSQMDAGSPGVQNVPNMPLSNPRGAGRSAGESLEL
jgi:hypothetical protein